MGEAPAEPSCLQPSTPLVLSTMTVHLAEKPAWARLRDCSALPGSAWVRWLGALPPCLTAHHPLPGAAQPPPHNLPFKLSSRSACTPAQFLNLHFGSLN